MVGHRTKVSSGQQTPPSPCWQCLTAEPKQVLVPNQASRRRAACFSNERHAWPVCFWRHLTDIETVPTDFRFWAQHLELLAPTREGNAPRHPHLPACKKAKSVTPCVHLRLAAR